jgi:nucleoside-diphosphate-sugar epimerase
MNKNLWKPLIDSELQIWCIPPRVKINGDFFYTEIIQEWLEYLKGSPVQKIIFLSSTSVYLPIDGIINEESEVHMDSIIFKAEQLIEQSKIPHLILRLGGLMGADRYVGKYYSGKQVDRANGPVNYIHLDDAVQFTLSAINCDLVGIFNLVAPEHPLRKDVVEQSCLKHQLPLPTGYLYNEIAPKIISSEKITNTLDLAFIHPNPIDF